MESGREEAKVDEHHKSDLGVAAPTRRMATAICHLSRGGTPLVHSLPCPAPPTFPAPSLPHPPYTPPTIPVSPPFFLLYLHPPYPIRTPLFTSQPHGSAPSPTSPPSPFSSLSTRPTPHVQFFSISALYLFYFFSLHISFLVRVIAC